MKLFSKRKASEGSSADQVGELHGVQGRPKLSEAFTDELKRSVKKLEDKKKRKSRFSFLSPKKNLEGGDGADGRLTKQLSMSREMAKELKMSFHDRQSKRDLKREEIRERIMKRRKAVKKTTKAGSLDGDDSENDSHDSRSRRPQSSLNNYLDEDPTLTSSRQYQRPRIKQELANELKMSIHSRQAKRDEHRREIKERIMKRRQSRSRLTPPEKSHQPFVKKESHKSPSKKSFDKKSEIKKRSNRDKKRKKKKLPKRSSHSMESFANASLSDNSDDSIGWREKYRPKALNDRKTRKQSYEKNIFEDEGIILSHTETNFELKRLRNERKQLKDGLLASKSQISKLSQKLEDYRAECKDLRKQLSTWQDKASKFSKLQSEEKQKFDSSADLIARARIDLTKALNENRMLKNQVYDLESSVGQRDRRFRSLHETIELQSEKVDDIAMKFKDSEAELRFVIEEKHRTEEELAVLVASRDGKDVGKTIRRLEEEKAQWLDERERVLEAKRRALDEENERILERERIRYQEERGQRIEVSKQTRIREKESQQMQDAINLQLQGLKESNQSLQDRLTGDRLEFQLGLKEKEQTIASLELEVSKVRRKFPSSELKEKEIDFRKAEADAAKADLKDARRTNRDLERQIENLKSDSREPRQQPEQDWREIILPGYRNLRGVTFGSDLDSLAGFLTILVEEQSKRAETSTKTVSRMSNYLKDPKVKSKSKSKSKGKSKSKSKSKSTSKGKRKRKRKRKSKSKGKRKKTSKKAKSSSASNDKHRSSTSKKIVKEKTKAKDKQTRSRSNQKLKSMLKDSSRKLKFKKKELSSKPMKSKKQKLSSSKRKTSSSKRKGSTSKRNTKRNKKSVSKRATSKSKLSSRDTKSKRKVKKDTKLDGKRRKRSKSQAKSLSFHKHKRNGEQDTSKSTKKHKIKVHTKSEKKHKRDYEHVQGYTWPESGSETESDVKLSASKLEAITDKRRLKEGGKRNIKSGQKSKSTSEDKPRTSKHKRKGKSKSSKKRTSKHKRKGKSKSSKGGRQNTHKPRKDLTLDENIALIRKNIALMEKTRKKSKHKSKNPENSSTVAVKRPHKKKKKKKKKSSRRGEANNPKLPPPTIILQ